MMATAMFLLILVGGIFAWRDGRLTALWHAINGTAVVKGQTS